MCVYIYIIPLYLTNFHNSNMFTNKSIFLISYWVTAAILYDPSTAALRRRQARDLEGARARCERVDLTHQKKTLREKVVMEAASSLSVTGAEAERDPQRLLAATKASESHALSCEAMDQAERRRKSVGAHGAAIALNARDLQYSGRAIPQWFKAARANF